MSGSSEVGIETKLGNLWITLPVAIHMDNYREIEQHIEVQLTSGSKKVVLDFGGTKNIYSSGMGLLIRLRKRIAEVGGSLALVNVSKACRELLASVNLDRMFTIYATDVEFEISQDDVWADEDAGEDIGFLCVPQVEDGICRINLSGQMSAFKDLSQFDEHICQDNVKSYVFDITGLDAIDSYGAHLLAKVTKIISDKGGKCVSYGANESVKELLELLALDEFMPSYENEREALEAIK